MPKKPTLSVCSLAYWKEALGQFSNVRMLSLAALFVALRVAVKLIYIPVGPDLGISIDFLVNALGSAIYGPLVGLVCGALSDNISAILFPQGVYFPLFMVIEMAGSFIFGLCLWKRNITALRLMLSKLVYTVICNFLMMPYVMILYYRFLEIDKAYAFVTIPRVVKNLALLPVECFLLVLFFSAILPASGRRLSACVRAASRSVRARPSSAQKS